MKEVFLILLVVVSVGTFGMTVRLLIDVVKKKKLDFGELTASFLTSFFTALLVILTYLFFNFLSK